MLDVVCFGEILWDVFEASPRGREPIARRFVRELGGAPANVATGLARLGTKVALVGAVGKDPFGDALLFQLRADGVDARFVQRLDQRTGLTFVVRDDRGEPTFIFYRHESADVSIRADRIPAAAARARWVLVGTSTLMTPELTRSTERLLALAEASRAKLFVDLNVRPHLWSSRSAMRDAIVGLARRGALVKASDADLRALGSGRWDAARLKDLAPDATWLLTRGPGSASAIGPHGDVSLPAIRARAVDATGAGDAFIAGALSVLLASGAAPGTRPWHDRQVWLSALRAGHMMGKKAIAHAGAVAGLTHLGQVQRLIARARSESRN